MASLCDEFFPIAFHDQVILDDGVDSGAYTPLKLPYCSSQSLAEPDPDVGGLVVSLHGVGGDAAQYLTNALDARARTSGPRRKTVVVAPQFANEGEISGPIPPDVLFWTGGRFWGSPSGSTDANPRSARIRSFDALDRFLEGICGSGVFPALKRIVIVGHSGGAQFTNRYAAASPFEDAVATPAGIELRYVMLNPGTYLYLDGQRPLGGALNQFAAPGAFGGCPGYDAYGFGLESLWSYPGRQGADALRTAFGAREVVYMLGSDDTSATSSFPASCEAMLQGANRLERGIAYYNHVVLSLGGDVQQRHRLVVVEGLGHWGWGMMTSDDGVREIFGPMAVDVSDLVRVPLRRDLRARLDRRVGGFRRILDRMRTRQPAPDEG